MLFWIFSVLYFVSCSSISSNDDSDVYIYYPPLIGGPPPYQSDTDDNTSKSLCDTSSANSKHEDSGSDIAKSGESNLKNSKRRRCTIL